MDVLMPVLFSMVLVGIFGAVIWLFVSAHRHRRLMLHGATSSLQALAQQHGWGFTFHAPNYADGFSGYPFGGLVHSSREVLRGSFQNRSVSCFQLHRQESGPPPSINRFFRVFTLTLAHEVPTLQLTPTGDDVRPRGDDQLAMAVLTTPLREWLARQHLPLRFEGNELITWYRQKGPFGPQDVDAGLQFLTDAANRLPAEIGRPTR